MRTILLVFLSVCTLNGICQSVNFGDKAQVYLVRHGEKEAGDDPLLTAEGYKRAGDLARTLQSKKLARVYVTDYKRTRQTGDSVSLQQGIPVITYLADTSCADLVQKIIENKDTNNPILIIGHSNTIPLVIRKLGMVSYPADYIPAQEFDNLFLLTYKGGKPSLRKSKYGVPSGASAPMH